MTVATVRWVLRALLICILLSAGTACADVFRPAYLQLQQRDPQTFDVTWKIPALDEATTIAASPVFPAATQELTTRTSTYAGGATILRWRITVPGGLEGKTIRFAGLAASGLDVLVRVERSDGTEQVDRILPGAPTFQFEASPGRFEVARTYTLLGIEHIWTGVDHLLFVLSLVVIVRGKRRLVATITAFTLAHSITLVLATLNILRVPGPPVEATIALSIVFVAVEIVRRYRGEESLTARKPWIVAFSFGLLHGLGFASALAQIGLPQNDIPLALLFFNVGVEIGQLLFIATVLAAASLVQRFLRARLAPRWTVALPGYMIGGTASYWMIDRIAAFWQ